MKREITFLSDGLRLSGIVDLPDDLKPGERRPAVVALHGFGSQMDDGMVQLACRLFAGLGYITLRFDMRGCGSSEGERARVICLEQVRDTSSAVSYLQSLPEVDPQAIAVLGHSFGAAVAVYAAAMDERIAACMSSAGWGDGETKLRQQHAGDEAWARFTDMLARGREAREAGRTLWVSRFDIVPIPAHMRGGLPPGAFMEFPFEVVESMLAFRPIDVVARIAPRPLLLLHPAVDAVTPSAQSIELFRHARMPADLHLFAAIDHFIFSDDNVLVLDFLKGWLAKNLPLKAADATFA